MVNQGRRLMLLLLLLRGRPRHEGRRVGRRVRLSLSLSLTVRVRVRLRLRVCLAGMLLLKWRFSMQVHLSTRRFARPGRRQPGARQG